MAYLLSRTVVLHPDGAAVVVLSGIECKIVHRASCIASGEGEGGDGFLGVEGGE